VDRELHVMITLSLLINRIKMLLDILIRNDPLQSFSDNLLPRDLKVLLRDEIEDLDSALGVSKDNRLLEIFQYDLVEARFYFHLQGIATSIRTVSGLDGKWFLPIWHNPIPWTSP